MVTGTITFYAHFMSPKEGILKSNCPSMSPSFIFSCPDCNLVMKRFSYNQGPVYILKSKLGFNSLDNLKEFEDR